MEEPFPQIGEKFPEIVAQTTQGVKKFPIDYEGKWLVFFSHPADFTPVCTTEFESFQNHFHQFQDLNTELVALSIDQVFSHIKWIEWISEKLDCQIEFPVIADDTGAIAKKLGLIHQANGTNTVRAVFIIDPNGNIRAMLNYPQELGRNIMEILRMVKGLQVSDSKNVAIPADWPENNLIKDKLIIPPATDMNHARKRMNEYNGYDWWFCYKDYK